MFIDCLKNPKLVFSFFFLQYRHESTIKPSPVSPSITSLSCQDFTEYSNDGVQLTMSQTRLCRDSSRESERNGSVYTKAKGGPINLGFMHKVSKTFLYSKAVQF